MSQKISTYAICGFFFGWNTLVRTSRKWCQPVTVTVTIATFIIILLQMFYRWRSWDWWYSSLCSQTQGWKENWHWIEFLFENWLSLSFTGHYAWLLRLSFYSQEHSELVCPIRFKYNCVIFSSSPYHCPHQCGDQNYSSHRPGAEQVQITQRIPIWRKTINVFTDI